MRAMELQNYTKKSIDNMNKKHTYNTLKILFITGSNPPHPFHNSLAKSLNSDFFQSNINVASKFGIIGKIFNTIKSALSLPYDYDIYLSETVYVVPALAKFLGIISKKSKIVNISADPVLYDLVHKRKYTTIDKMQNYFIKYVDGFVLIGPWGSLLKKLHISTPYIEIPAGVNDDRHALLLKKKININARNHNIVFVGNISQNTNPSSNRITYKGFDILDSAFKDILTKYPDSKLYILGSSDADVLKENIISTGFKTGKEFVDILSKMSIAAHVSRGDAFCIGATEAMLAGIPTFVSESTGARIIVEKVDKNFVIPLSSKKLSAGIIKYFKLSKGKKLKISKKFREAAKPYTLKRVVKTFPQKFKMLVGKIEETRKSANKT